MPNYERTGVLRPTILTCSVVGARPLRKDNPAVPYTPKEIANEAIAAARAGASVVHLHVRHPETGAASMEFAHYRETVDRIRDSGTDVILNLTTGSGARYEFLPDDLRTPGLRTTLSSPERRCEHVLKLKPELCTLDLDTLMSGTGTVTVNLAEHVRRIAALVQSEGVKPELEVFSPGDIVLAHDLIAEGTLKTPLLFQMVLGVKYGAPATTQMMQAMQAMLPEGSQWAAFGIGRLAYPMLAQAFLLGGHVRVGMEDNLYLERGKLTPGNGALIEKAVRIVHELGGSIATPAEARSQLGLKPPS